ncbi:MAG: C1 family peptidase [Bdellovibrionota bacterium]
MKTKYLIIVSLFIISFRTSADIDLDQSFLKATGSNLQQHILPENKTNSLAEMLDKIWTKTRDGSAGFPPVVSQKPIGACQSFEITAQMEYIFYFETGSVIKFSEKHTTYRLLKMMIDDFWDAEKKAYSTKPALGQGIAPFVIDVVTSIGMMPEQNYPWGDFASDSGSRSIDLELFKNTFEAPARDYSPEEYRRLLDQVFLSAPPNVFYYILKMPNFATGSTEDVVLRSSKEINQYIGVSKDRFIIRYNKDRVPTFNKTAPEDVQNFLKWASTVSETKKIPYEVTGGEQIIASIKESLDRLMVVGIAADVWSGSWTDKMVYAGGGGHAMVVVGYQTREDGKTYFKLRNSWGPKIGVDGYNLVEESVLLPNIYYTIEYK